MLRFYRKKLDLAIITFISSSFLFLLCALILAAYFITGRIDNRKIKKLNKEIKQEVVEANNDVDRYINLRDRYPDLAGYVTFNYYKKVNELPLMHCKDNDYYLYRDIDGKSSQRGTPFIDYRCDVKNSLLLVLYAHNMRDLSQFGSLKEYRNEEYKRKYPYIYFETMYEKRTPYEVVAAFYSEVFSDDRQDVFKYYNYFDLPTQADYNYYVYNIKRMALYDTGIKPEFGEKLILLSTCDSYKEDGRFAVLARKVTTIESPLVSGN